MISASEIEAETTLPPEGAAPKFEASGEMA